MKSAWVLLVLFFIQAVSADKPKIASMNLCTDRLVLALADARQIISLSHVARDPHSMVQIANSDTPLNHGQLEEMLQYDVDLIVASEYDNPRTLHRLFKYGRKVTQFKQANSIDQVVLNIKQMAQLLDQSQRGEDMVNQINASYNIPEVNNRPRTLILGANGYISGTNSLASDIISKLGFYNIANDINRRDNAQLSLEEIVMLKPQVIILNQYSSDYSRPQAVLLHPVLKRLNKQVRIYSVPTKDWICGDQSIVNIPSRLQ